MAAPLARAPLPRTPNRPAPAVRLVPRGRLRATAASGGGAAGLVLRTCKNCKQQYDPAANHPSACRYHTAHFGGEIGLVAPSSNPRVPDFARAIIWVICICVVWGPNVLNWLSWGVKKVTIWRNTLALSWEGCSDSVSFSLELSPMDQDRGNSLFENERSFAHLVRNPFVATQVLCQGLSIMSWLCAFWSPSSKLSPPHNVNPWK